MVSFKKIAKATLRYFRFAGLGIGTLSALLGFFADASGGATFWSLSANTWFDLGILLIALFGAASVVRHDYLLHEFDELWGNEHAQRLMRDGIPLLRETYFQYVRKGEYGTVNRFWSAGLYNVTDLYGRSDLDLASENGHKAIVRGIIERGGDPKRPNSAGMTPLMLASAGGHEAVVDVLLEFDCGTHATSNDGGVSALYAAASNGHTEVAKQLVKAGAPIDAPDHDNITPLMAAIVNGQWDTVEFLLDAGANVSRIDACGANVADYVAIRRHDAPTAIQHRVHDAGVLQSDPELICTGTGHNYTGKVDVTWETAKSRVSPPVAIDQS